MTTLSAVLRPTRRSGRPLAVLLIAASVLAFAVGRGTPLVASMPEYLADAQQWTLHAGMASTFTPLGYPLFIAPALQLGEPVAVIVLQAALYIATVAIAYLLLTRLGASPRLAAFGSVPILLDPELFGSITKIWDVGLSTFLFLLFALVCLRLQRHGPTTARVVLVGIVFAAGLFCRANLALLAPVIAYAVWSSRPRPAATRVLSAVAVVFLTTILVYALAGVAAHGKPFVPTNGPYNLYVGNNAYAAQSLLERLNGEPSLYPSMRAQHPDIVPEDAGTDFFHQPGLQPLYMRDAIDFIRDHPLEDARLTGIKVFTFFRPDTKVHALDTKAGLFKAVLALPALLLLLALIPVGRPTLTASDVVLLAIDVAYVLPFVLTNADPRFRTPLDALMILHVVHLLSVRFRRADSLSGPSTTAARHSW